MNRRLLAFVPAKGKNERFPGKNLFPFLGKPLIRHTVDFLKGLDACDIIVVTDSEEIGAACKDVRVVRVSPPAGRAVKDVEQAYRTLSAENGFLEKYAQVGMFLPTAPVRRKQDIVNCRLALEEGFDGGITVSYFDFPPSLAISCGNSDTLELNFPDAYFSANTRSQDQPVVFRPNGMGYITRRENFERFSHFFGGRVRGTLVPREYLFDIDYHEDLKRAELLAEAIQQR